MATFEEIINPHITYRPFKFIMPCNMADANKFFDDMYESMRETSENITCCVGDWDVDGVHSLKIWHNMMNDLGLKNHDNYFGQEKVHGIDKDFVNLCMSKKYKYVVIVDSSCNNMEEINFLVSMGIRVLIIDHHVCNYDYKDYPANCVIINAKMQGNENLKEISAGMLTYIVTSYIRNHRGMQIKTIDYIYGYITLISDSCKLSDEYIKPIILTIGSLNEIPAEIQLFTNKYTIINKDFFIYKYNNIINNMCRLERIDLVMKLFFSDNSMTEKQAVVEEMRQLHNWCKEKMNDLADRSVTYQENFGDCVICNMDELQDLTELPHNYLVNSTGLLASKISANTQKAAMVYMSYTGNTFKFSGRDTRSKFPFQQMLKELDIDGGGHIGAIGFEISKVDLELIKNFIKSAPNDYAVKSQCLTLTINNYSEESLKQVFLKVAMYNEVCCGDMQPIEIRIKLKSNEFITKDIGKKRIFSKGSITVEDLMQKSFLDDEVTIKPIFNKFKNALVSYL